MLKRGRGRPRKIQPDTLTDVGDSAPKMVNFSVGEVPYSHQLPEFFKIYLPHMSSQTLRIPPLFTKKFCGNIPSSVTLKRSTGVSWQVDMNKINYDWFFKKGWPEFVQENSLEDGDFLTFCYVGNSTFSVNIYSPNGCIKRTDDTSSIDSESSENMQENEASQSESSKNKESIRRNLEPESSMAITSDSVNPSFSLIMTKAYCFKGFMRVPMEFWRLYMKDDEKGPTRVVTLWIKDKAWVVRLITRTGRARFSKGCSKFVRDNSLEMGNLCIFQLIDRNDLAFEVTIYR